MTTPSLPAECRKLFLQDFDILARIGIHDFEQAAPQRLLINVELYVPLKNTLPKQDHISNVVDYDFIRGVVQRRIAQGHINLQETLCDDVLASLLQHPLVLAARVSSRKPDVYPDCAAVGVEVFGQKADAGKPASDGA
jgi:7,8-dihydroneopterin aldolase/epimerase/oxygenase